MFVGGIGKYIIWVLILASINLFRHCHSHGRKVLRFVMKERGGEIPMSIFVHYYLYLMYLLLEL